MAATHVMAGKPRSHERPRPVDGSAVRVRTDGVAILSLAGRHMELSARAHTVWRTFDGTSDRASIAQRYCQRFDVDASASINALIDRLYARGFITLGGDDRSPHPLIPQDRPIRPNGLLEAYITCSPERALEAAYARLHWLFHPIALFAIVALSAVGMFLFARLPHPQDPLTPGMGIALGVAFLASTVIHEAGHALPLRHFGGMVRRAGVGFYWFAPTAFVDTSDAYLFSCKRRVLVTLGGPIASLFVAALAVVIAVAGRHTIVAGPAWTLAAVTYSTAAWNMNPLIELDGYYLLVDLLGRPNLRHDSFARLLNGRLDVIAALYAGGAFVYASALVFIAIPTLVRRLLATSFGPLLPHQLAVALPAVAAGCAALTVIAAIRTAARPAPAATLASGVLGTR